MSAKTDAAAGHAPPLFADIAAAAETLRPILAPAPLFESAVLNRVAGGRLLVKAETLLPTGSFKIRGACNRIGSLPQSDRDRGVLALSSGNHGLAVAWAARRSGITRTVILMPRDTPSTKVERAKELGAEVVFFDRRTADRQQLIGEWMARDGLVFIPAFDDPHIMAGAGTGALEAAEEVKAGGGAVDNYVAACSGGGLIAGSALALSMVSPDTRVWAVEPEDYDDTARSLEKGHREAIRPTGETICDALLSLIPGELTFEVNKRLLSGVIRASDAQARRGMRVAFEEFGLVAEPGGALALGALLSDRTRTEDRTTVVVLSGRNVDPAVFASCLV